MGESKKLRDRCERFLESVPGVENPPQGYDVDRLVAFVVAEQDRRFDRVFKETQKMLGIRRVNKPEE